MHLLIVGGGGYVGSIIRDDIEADHLCNHYDLKPIPGKGRMIIGDVNDPNKVSRAVRGMDAVLYMPLGVRPGTISNVTHVGACFDVHAQGFYHFVRAGLDHGIRRFIYVSSLAVYASSLPFTEADPTDDFLPYGLSKRLGEYVGQAAVQHSPDTCIISLRLCFPRRDADWPIKPILPASSFYNLALGPNDTRRLFLAALRFDRPGWHLINATGDIEGKWCPHARALDLLGWKPEGK